MNQNNLLKAEVLCKACGLCCTGVFHNNALLYTDYDISIAKKENFNIGFNKKENLNRFTLPCPAFCVDCSIYPERPSVCSSHKCDLLQSVISNDMVIEEGLNLVEKMQNVLNDILPEFKELVKNEASNNPVILMNTVLEDFKDESSMQKFKKKHYKLLLKFGVFTFLKHKYFYKKDMTSLT